MSPSLKNQWPDGVTLRSGRLADLDALLSLEERSFRVDRLSRRSFRRLLAASTARLIVAEYAGRCAGYALVLFRSTAASARLYSLCVAPEVARRGIGAALLAAAEREALKRKARAMRLEVQLGNAAAIARYEKSGYIRIGTRAQYYDDGSDALRYEKRLVRARHGGGK